MSVLIESHAVQVLKLAPTQSSGNLPVCRDWSKIIMKKGHILLAAFFRIKFGSSSGPDAFPPLKPSSNLVTPWTVISNLGISVFGGPSNLGIFVVSSEAKTEQNWLFSISALRLLSECSWLFSFKGDTISILTFWFDITMITPEWFWIFLF